MKRRAAILLLCLVTSFQAFCQTIAQAPSGIRLADRFAGVDLGGKINAALADLPSTGGRISANGISSGTLFSTPIVISKSGVVLELPLATITYTGTGAAIRINAAAVTIAGGGHIASSGGLGDVGTTLLVINTAATGIDTSGLKEGVVIRDLNIIGPGKGTGCGIRFTSNNGAIERVRTKAFGLDGVQIDGIRGNSNNVSVYRARSESNVGCGFRVISGLFGGGANVIDWLGTDAANNAGTANYCLTNIGNTFMGAHSSGAASGTGFYIDGSGNSGTIYSEPALPEKTALQFSSNAKNNRLFLVNGHVVVNHGTNNSWFVGETDAGSSISGADHLFAQTETNDSALNPWLTLRRGNTNTELTNMGIFFASANNRTGYTLATASGINLSYNNSGAGNPFRIFNNTTDVNIATADPVFSLDTSGNALFSGHGMFTAGIKAGASGSFISGDFSNTATLNYSAIAAQSCQEQMLRVIGANRGKAAYASPAASLGNINLSWSAWVSAADTVNVRVCNPSTHPITPSGVSWQAWVLQ